MIARYKISKYEDEKKALLNVFESGAWVNGSELDEASIQLKKIFNKKYCTLTSNGYSALFLAIKSLRIKNEKIIVPAASTCFAIVNAVIASGNQPVFADMNLSDATINFESAKRLQKQHRVKCIIVANLFGNLTNCSELKKELGITVIEDCAQSFLSNINHASEADMQVFSFYPTKIINGIDGGCVLTDDEFIANYIKDVVYYDEQLKYDGKERYNMRMPNIHAAVLLSNLNKIEQLKKEFLVMQDDFEKLLNSAKKYKVVKNTGGILSRFILLFNTNSDKRKFANACKEKNIQVSDVLANVSDTEIIENSQTFNLIHNTLSIPYYVGLLSAEKEILNSVLHD